MIRSARQRTQAGIEASRAQGLTKITIEPVSSFLAEKTLDPNTISFLLPHIEEGSEEDSDVNDKTGRRRRHRRRRLVRWFTSTTFTRRVVAITITAAVLYLMFFGVSVGYMVQTSGGNFPGTPKLRRPSENNVLGEGYTPNLSGKQVAESSKGNHQMALLTQNDGRVKLPDFVSDRNAKTEHPVIAGRLQVDLKSTVHPIYQLIRDARENWEVKKAKQSKTLDEAVVEYVRRYNRQPPKGFDKWWQYVVEHNVQMPDEYDQIMKDMAPFYGLSPATINERTRQLEGSSESSILEVSNGQVSYRGNPDAERIVRERLTSQVDILTPIAQWIPNFTAIFSHSDTPRVLITHDHRSELKERAEEGDYIDTSVVVEGDGVGWASACPYNSPINNRRKLASGIDWSMQSKSFITSHTANMDICENPELIPITGLLARWQRFPSTSLLPFFSISKTNIHADILTVAPERHSEAVVPTPWKEKQDAPILWRGTNTGLHYDHLIDWRLTQRMRLTGLTMENEGSLEILATPKDQGRRAVGDAAVTVPKGIANKHYLDFGFTSAKAIQCDPSACAEIEANYPFVSRVEPHEADKRKFVMDMDGNAWSARFHRVMTSGSLLFKATIMPEWWSDRSQPWVHYVPVKMDYTDLYDSLAFFKGDVLGENGEEALAEDIATEGLRWVKSYFRREDMTAYAFRMYLEWARVSASGRGSAELDYVHLTEGEGEGAGKG